MTENILHKYIYIYVYYIYSLSLSSRHTVKHTNVEEDLQNHGLMMMTEVSTCTIKVKGHTVAVIEKFPFRFRSVCVERFDYVRSPSVAFALRLRCINVA